MNNSKLPGSSQYNVSPHAEQQMKKRGFLPDDILYIIENGEFLRSKTDRSIYLIPESSFACLGGNQRQKLSGAAVILANDGTIVTVLFKDYRFENGILE
jgi:hypothetical protein